MRGAIVAAAAIVFGCAGRRDAQLSAELLQTVRASRGAYVSGSVEALGRPVVVDDRDFGYAIAFSPDGERVAFTHLGGRHSMLSIANVADGRRWATVEVNPNEFDLEDVAFSPDGAAVAVVSRDGAVRAYSSEGLKPLAAYQSDESLVSLAFHPGGRFLVVGSDRGLVTTLRWPSMRFAAELRAHTDAVSALSFGGGALWSASWDKTIARHEFGEELVSQTHARLPLAGDASQKTVRLGVNGVLVAAFGFDQRLPQNVVSSAVAKALGGASTETVTLPTALGAVEAPLLRNVTLGAKGVELPDATLAVCDACLPRGTFALLGAPFFERVQVAFDETHSEALLTLKTPNPPSNGVRLSTLERRAMPGHLNDLSLSADGRSIAVAMSTDRAVRTREIYERERRGQPLADGEADQVAVLGLGDGGLENARLASSGVHQGIVATASLSPDGATVCSGGWDRTVRCGAAHGLPQLPLEQPFGWTVRKVRFSPDGRHLGVAAWTPQNASGDQRSKPSVVVFPVVYGADVTAVPPPTAR